MLTTPWRANHGAVATAHLFVIGDVHGHAKELGEILDHIDMIQPQQGADREIIFIGDLIDRGPDSLGCVELAMAAKSRCDTCFVLSGNHELMMLAAPRDVMKFHHWYESGGDAVLAEVNRGGTLSAMDAYSALMDRLPDGFVALMENGPTFYAHNGILMVHAGIHPFISSKTFLAEGRDSAPWAWIRESFLDYRGGWQDHYIDLVVHGHTSATYEAFAHADEIFDKLDLSETHHRINVDAGSKVIPQVACVEIHGDQHRFHVAGPKPLLPA